jgi:hypothetical protein
LVASVVWPLATVVAKRTQRLHGVWGLSHERSDIAGAEGFHSLEGNICGTVMRGADALPGSKATSRATGSHRNLGDLVAAVVASGVCTAVRIGEARSRSR